MVGVVDAGMVDGGVVGGIVGGTETAVVGGGVMMVLVGGAVGSGVGGGGSVGGGDICGGDVVPGETGPVLRGAVVFTENWVVAVVPPGPGAAVVDDVSMDVEVELVEELDVVDAPVAEVGRAVVDVGDWVATCCLGDVSPPVATSNSRAAKARVARAYSPTLKRYGRSSPDHQ